MKLANDAKTKRQETLKAVLHHFYHDTAQSGSHCKFNLKYHIVWIPKYRRKVLTEQMAIRLKAILSEIAQEYRFNIIAMEVMPDHIHILLEAPQTYSPSQIVGILKGLSSPRLRKEFLSHIQRFIWKRKTLWARGYYIATVADGATTKIVKEYINNQKLHDHSDNNHGKYSQTQLPQFE